MKTNKGDKEMADRKWDRFQRDGGLQLADGACKGDFEERYYVGAYGYGLHVTGDEPYFYGGIEYAGFQNVCEEVNEPSLNILDPLRRDVSEFDAFKKSEELDVMDWFENGLLPIEVSAGLKDGELVMNATGKVYATDWYAEQDSGTVYFAEYRSVWKKEHSVNEDKEEFLYLPFVD